MIQGRDLFKVILAVGAIIALVFVALHFANSQGTSVKSGESPKLVISGINTNGAVPALENFPSTSSSTKKSGYTGTLETKYRARQPVDCLAGSELSFSFPDGKPDKLRAYFTYYGRSGESVMLSDEYEALVYGGAVTLPSEGMDFTVYPTGIYSSYIDADYDPSALPRVYSTIVFYKLVAIWDDEEFEYAFAVNLEDASQPVISASSSNIPPRIAISGINSSGKTVAPECYAKKLISKASRSDFKDVLGSMYDLNRPVDFLESSELSLSFPDGEPDELQAYNIRFTYNQVYDGILEESDLNHDFYNYLNFTDRYSGSSGEENVEISNNKIKLPDNPKVTYIHSDGNTTVYVKEPKIFYRLAATWGNNTYEYIFAVNLVDASAPDTSDNDLYIPGGFPNIYINGIESSGKTVSVDTVSVVPATRTSVNSYLSEPHKIREMNPTDIAAGSKLNFVFDNNMPDNLILFCNRDTNHLFFKDKITPDNFHADIIPDQQYSYIAGSDTLITADNFEITLPDYPQPSFTNHDERGSVINTDSPVIYYKALATWGRYTYEYLFCINLTNTDKDSETSVK